jgi:trans-aconitate methyltransferase
MANFSEISSRYEKDSVVQKSASELLFDLLDIQPNDSVLDLGCGTGHLAKLIRHTTRGRIIGVDPSEGMILKAKENNPDQDLSFYCCSAEQLEYINEFDKIFCNSAFQWFMDYKKALQKCFAALKSNGKIAIQAPATDHFCPNFMQAIEEVKKHNSTSDTFAKFTSPWLFRNTAEEYSGLFAQAGFKVETSYIDRVVTSHTAAEAYNIFESGAAAGYLNSSYYPAPLSHEYLSIFRDSVKKSFAEQASKTGQIDLVFHRIYLLAVKNDG